MTHLSVPPWHCWLWPDATPPSGGRMTLDRFRRLKEPEPEPKPLEPELPALPGCLPVLSKLELFMALPIATEQRLASN